ncbi:MAG TPA: hypothetical protein VFC46_11665 [Humisphaera sp.]|nr:hypothetical protein [Humisphaera sp.]
MANDGEDSDKAHPAGKWIFPGDKPGRENADETDDAEPPSVLLRSVSEVDARSICILLESEGVGCDAIRAAPRAEAPPGEPMVDVLVAETDLELAREIIARPKRGKDRDEDQFERELAKVNESNWICPKCRRRTLKVMPLSEEWRRLRLGCLCILVLPFILALLAWAIPAEGLRAFVYSLDGPPVVIWLLVVVILGALLISAPRHKRCGGCGWRSDRTRKKY